MRVGPLDPGKAYVRLSRGPHTGKMMQIGVAGVFPPSLIVTGSLKYDRTDMVLLADEVTPDLRVYVHDPSWDASAPHPSAQ